MAKNLDTAIKLADVFDRCSMMTSGRDSVTVVYKLEQKATPDLTNKSIKEITEILCASASDDSACQTIGDGTGAPPVYYGKDKLLKLLNLSTKVSFGFSAEGNTAITSITFGGIK